MSNNNPISGKSWQINSHLATIFDTTSRGERAVDLKSHMLHNYTIFFFGEVNDMITEKVCAEILFLSQQDSTKEITMYINSHGGSLYDAIAIVDIMARVPNPISTVVMGKAFSAGALILAAGTKGRRIAMQNSTIMLHQPSSGTKGTATDIQIAANEIVRMKHLTNEMLTKFSSIDKELFLKEIEKDWFMSAQEGYKNGLVDIILEENQKV
jgi:ATP-dependent Clp protease protease subunit